LKYLSFTRLLKVSLFTYPGILKTTAAFNSLFLMTGNCNMTGLKKAGVDK
jgi:hypothetical protein